MHSFDSRSGRYKSRFVTYTHRERVSSSTDAPEVDCSFNTHFDGMHRHANAIRPNEVSCPSSFDQSKPFGHQLVYTSGPPRDSRHKHILTVPMALICSSHRHPSRLTLLLCALRSLHSFDSRIDRYEFRFVTYSSADAGMEDVRSDLTHI